MTFKIIIEMKKNTPIGPKIRSFLTKYLVIGVVFFEIRLSSVALFSIEWGEFRLKNAKILQVRHKEDNLILLKFGVVKVQTIYCHILC